MLIRLGVQLAPKQADIFDVIASRAKLGLHIDVLCGVIYPGKSMSIARNTLKVFIWQINERLVSTDFEIRSPGGGMYQLTARQETTKTPHKCSICGDRFMGYFKQKLCGSHLCKEENRKRWRRKKAESRR